MNRMLILVLSVMIPFTLAKASVPDHPQHAEVIVYTSDLCSWCKSVKELLDSKGVHYKEIDVRGNKSLIDEMEKNTGSRKVPQVLINGKNIGGYLAITTANITGELDELLGLNADHKTEENPKDASSEHPEA